VPHHNKKSKDNVLRTENDIRALRAQGKTNDEVMAILKIPMRSYRRYCSAINKKDKQIWYSLVRDEVESQFLMLKNSLEHTYHRARELSEKDDYDSILEALETANSARVSIIQLLVEGPQMIEKINVQLPKNETKPNVETNDWRERGKRVLNHEE